MGDQGYSAIEILRNFYGIIYQQRRRNFLYSCFMARKSPGHQLSDIKVRQIQEQLNVIANSYPALPKITADGIYGEATQNAIREFQKVFGLPVTGVVDYSTWYEIQKFT